MGVQEKRGWTQPDGGSERKGGSAVAEEDGISGLIIIVRTVWQRSGCGE